MSACWLEICLQPGADDPPHEFLADSVAGEAEDVGVVVSPGKLRGQFVMAECSPDARDLVPADAHADPAAADEYASVGLARRDALGCGISGVRIIATLGAVGAHVQRLMSQLAQKQGDLVLRSPSAMIRSYCDFHNHNLFSYARTGLRLRLPGSFEQGPSQGLLYMLCRLLVHAQVPADGVWNVLLFIEQLNFQVPALAVLGKALSLG